MKDRDYSVDIIRIIATFVVVATHVKLSWIVDNVVNNQKLFYACLWADGVSLFFLITGFFLFNGRGYGHIIKKTIKSVILPALMVAIFSQMIGPWIRDSRLIGGNLNLQIPFDDLVRAIMKQSAGDVDFCFHFWYIFTYLKVILFFPLLKWICQEGKEQNLSRRVLIGLSVVDVGVHNLRKFVPVEINTYSFFDVAVLLVIIGYEISVHKNKIKSNTAISFLSGFFALTLLVCRFYSQQKLYEIDINDSTFINWDSIFGIIISSLFFVFIYSLNINKLNVKMKSIIMKLSEMSFYIYLIHVIVYFKLESMGIRTRVVNYFDKGAVGIAIFNIAYPLSVVCICLFLYFLCCIFKKKIKNFLRCLRNTKEIARQ